MLAGAAMLIATEGAAQTWPEDQYSRIRLLSETSALGGGEPIMLGIAIETRPHWKTYWRSAGEAGLPPRFEWRRSDEGKGAAPPQVLWPAPQRFAVQGIESYGYTQSVIFPVRIDPAGVAETLRIAVTADYAVCLEICVPQQAGLEISLPPGPRAMTASAAAIAAALARVPLTQTASTQPVIISARWMETGGTGSILVAARSERPFTAPDLFIDGAGEADADFLFLSPAISFSNDRREALFRTPVRPLNPARKPGETLLTLTLVDGERAVEHRTFLTP